MRGLSPEQRAERNLGIGGSDAGRIMNGDWRSLWKEKTGRAQPEDLSWNIAVQMGHCTEQFNAEYFEHVTGRKVTRRGEAIIGKRYPFMRANLDGVILNSKANLAYWDAKHVGRSDEAMVLRYTPQMTHCAFLIGADYWVLSVFVGNNKHEIIEQEVDPFYLEDLLAKEAEFWGFVERDEEPRDRVEPVLAPKPERRLRNIDFNGPAEELAAKYNFAPALLPEIHKFMDTEKAAKAHAICRDAIKSLVPDDVGELRRGSFVLTRSKSNAVTMKTEAKNG